VHRDRIDKADEMNLEVDSKDEVMHTSKWSICDFQRGGGRWSRKGDNRWGGKYCKKERVHASELWRQSADQFKTLASHKHLSSTPCSAMMESWQLF